jgi:hypothetical protein
MSAVDGLPPRRRIDELTAARSDSWRSMALTSRCFTTPQSPVTRMRQSIVGAETSLRRYWIRRADDISASHADPATFQVLQGSYGRGNTSVYYFDRPIANADPDGLLKDGNHRCRPRGHFYPAKPSQVVRIRQYHSRRSAYAG